MSDDKMRAEFEKWADSQCLPLTRINWDNGTISEYAYTATFDAWQVWQVAYQAGLKAEQVEVERLRAELAAAKAASGWPAGYTEIRTNPGGNVVIYTENHENAYRLIAWLRDRMKERSEG